MGPSGAMAEGVPVLLRCGLFFGAQEARACIQAPSATESASCGLGRSLCPIV